VLAGAALVAAGVALVIRNASPRLRITQESCDRIESGMTRTGVERILGGPPGKYFTKEPIIEMHDGPTVDGPAVAGRDLGW
jgi:hypothetical protein